MFAGVHRAARGRVHVQQRQVQEHRGVGGVRGRADTRQRGFARKGVLAAPDQGQDQELDRAGGLPRVHGQQVRRVVVQHRGVRAARRPQRVRHLRYVLREGQTHHRRHGRSDVAETALHADAHAFERVPHHRG